MDEQNQKEKKRKEVTNLCVIERFAVLQCTLSSWPLILKKPGGKADGTV